MAGLDGIQNKIHPGDAMDKDLYELASRRSQQHSTSLPFIRPGFRCAGQMTVNF